MMPSFEESSFFGSSIELDNTREISAIESLFVIC